MTADTPAQWTDLFVATAGVAAALTGLTFVAISLNIKPILEGGGIVERALCAVSELFAVVIVSILALTPESPVVLGYELLVVGLLLTAGSIRMLALSAAQRPEHEPSYLGSALLTTIPGVVPFALGGLSLIIGTGGGLYWILAGIVLALTGGVINAWVLLIEILR